MFGGFPCRGRTWKMETCYNNDFCTERVNGSWCMWTDWSTCIGDDVTSRRYRTCQCPPPVNGGTNCDGDEIDERQCNRNRTSQNTDTATRVITTKACQLEGSAASDDVDDDGDSSDECDLETFMTDFENDSNLLRQASAAGQSDVTTDELIDVLK